MYADLLPSSVLPPAAAIAPVIQPIPGIADNISLALLAPPTPALEAVPESKTSTLAPAIAPIASAAPVIADTAMPQGPIACIAECIPELRAC